MVQFPAPETVSTADVLPVIDLEAYLNPPGGTKADKQEMSKRVAESLQATGCLVVRDPRVDHAENDAFLNMMEEYFGRDAEQKASEIRPELSFQVGYTPECQEVPRAVKDPELKEMIRAQPSDHRAVQPTGADVKCRYMWPLRERSSSLFKELNPDQVSPEGIPGWSDQMDRWGGKLLDTAETVAEMAAIGFGLPPETFASCMKGGPHILAPTGSNLDMHNELGVCYAGFHYDLNLLTIHGKSRFPGLFVWLRDGRRVAVSIPDGCILLQAGKQLEWLTGGAVKAGMHEVVCTPATQAAIERARGAGRSLWRVSSTVFAHVASDVTLRPLDSFASTSALQEYPPTLAGSQVKEELKAIRLTSAPGA